MFNYCKATFFVQEIEITKLNFGFGLIHIITDHSNCYLISHIQ